MRARRYRCVTSGWTWLAALLMIPCSAPVRALPALAIPAPVMRYVQEGRFDEGGVLTDDPEGDLQTFLQYVQSNWSTMLDSITTIAPNYNTLCIFVAGAEEMLPGDYLSFLQKFAQEVDAKVIDPSRLRMLLLPTKFKVGCFEYNYKNAAVATILTKIQQSLDPGDPLQAQISDIQSGKARTDFLEYNDAYGGTLSQLVQLPK